MEPLDIIREGGIAALALAACAAVIFLARAYLALQKQFQDLTTKSVRASTESIKTLETMYQHLQANGMTTRELKEDMAKSMELLKSVKVTTEKVHEHVIEIKTRQED